MAKCFFTWQRFHESGLCLSALPPPPLWEFLRASKALRKPLTTSGWTRPELPSGEGSYYSIREDQNGTGGDRHLDHHTLRLVDYH
uniref:Uncharacterized protein n=1 Tax=Heterorhabditis bacteriophora TaxID=37862 RepID=A0A1I7XQ61_HETBA